MSPQRVQDAFGGLPRARGRAGVAGRRARSALAATVVHNVKVELISNLVWVVTALTLLSLTFRAVRRGRLRIPMASAMLLTGVVCFILLPIISISDDLLEARQAALPLSGQTWLLASEGLLAGSDQLVAVAICLMLITYAVLDSWLPACKPADTRNLAARLARSQRLRPPPLAF